MHRQTCSIPLFNYSIEKFLPVSPNIHLLKYESDSSYRILELPRVLLGNLFWRRDIERNPLQVIERGGEKEVERTNPVI
jgi:hypothetical protein